VNKDSRNHLAKKHQACYDLNQDFKSYYYFFLSR